MRPVVLAAWLLVAAGCVAPDPPRPYHEELLAAAPFSELVIEIDHAPGREPSVAAREHLLEQLRAVTSKSKVSVRVESSLPADDGRRWSSDDLVALEARTRTQAHAAPVAVLHVLYPAGMHANPDAAGITISGQGVATIAVFLDRIAEFDPGAGSPIPYPTTARHEVEKVTLLHEVGHALGLVNNGLPMARDHEDRASPGHSRNPRSVMTAAVEQMSGLREALLRDGTLPSKFDADDRADLRLGGGR